MTLNGWLILNVALGVAAGQFLWRVLKSARPKPDKPETEAESDWEFLWSNSTESAKEEIRAIVEDLELRKRAQAQNLWLHLWYAAPENLKVQMRGRWKELKMTPRGR